MNKTILFLSLVLAMMLGNSTKCVAQPTAKQWNKEVKAGWNLGNQLEATPPGFESESFAIYNADGADKAETGWGNPIVTKKMIAAVKKAGFNAVRIPVRWQCHITNDKAMTVSKTWMARVKEIVGYCLDNDLKVIINTHHDKWLEGRPFFSHKEENCQKLALLWNNIANEFKDYDYRLAFAGTNEVHVKDNWGAPTSENLEVQNAYNQIFVDMVRATGGNNAKRHLIVQTYVCNPDFGLTNNDFIIPQDSEENGNDYMSVEFHFYNPWDFCGSGEYKYWGEAYKQYGKISPSNEDTLINYFDRVASTWSAKGLGVVIGEWGVTDSYSSSDIDRQRENASYYCKVLVSEARKRGFSTFVWDNNAFGNGEEMFGIFDRRANMKVKAPWILKGIQEGIKE